MKAKYWVPVALGTAMQLCSHRAFPQQIPAIAFLADVHLQEVYAPLKAEGFSGVFFPKTGKYATIRTMQSQLNSTRLFNENYFAFIQALEELVEKKIKFVVLPGDFTDDGQPMNVTALQHILEHYRQTQGMRFFLTTGNHDPVSPFGSTGGKSDFLGTSGENQALAGTPAYYPNQTAAVTDQINHWGYYEICRTLAEFGFFPAAQDIFWTHPFEELDYDRYTWARAQSNSSLEKRSYQVPGTQLLVPDASYLVEPVPGLWLLALDGNTYAPKPDPNSKTTAWSNTSTGFNLTSVVKAYQLDWIKKITAEAQKRGKRLISFSHYPLVEYHSGATEDMKTLFGTGKHQLNRAPLAAVSERYAVAGLNIHLSGHMHFNNTSVHASPTGAKLVNLQVPSLAAFPPAYKIIEEKKISRLTIQTDVLEDVHQWDEFFDLYRMEQRWLAIHTPHSIWNEEILASPNFLSYTRSHLRELIRIRFLKSDWPEDLGVVVQALTLEELDIWAHLDASEGGPYLASLLTQAKSQQEPSTFKVGTLLEDFYLLKNGGDLGKAFIPEERKEAYAQIFRLKPAISENTSPLQLQLEQLLLIFSKLMNGLPSDDFELDLDKLNISPKK